MSVLDNFTFNSDFPALSKLPSVPSLYFTTQDHKLAGNTTETKTYNITIPANSIIQPIITQYLYTGFGGTTIQVENNITTTTHVARTSNTNVQVTWTATNAANVEQTVFGNSYRVDIELFTVK